MKFLILTILITGCQWKPQPEAIITPYECKRACKPGNMLSLDALEGSCICTKKRSK